MSKQILHYPQLDTVLMVEEFIREHGGEFRKRSLWENLPKKMMYQTFCVVFDYLEDSNKIATDTEGNICWIWDPAGVKKYLSDPDLKWNILKKDKTFECFVKINEKGKPKSIELKDLQQDISDIVLSSKVPEGVKRVFNGAKDLYLFGYFRYYFFTISNHYALLSLESALQNRHNQLFGKPRKSLSLNNVIKKLYDEEVIKKEDQIIYDILRGSRNYFSHLTSPPVVVPAAALSTLKRVKVGIEKLS